MTLQHLETLGVRSYRQLSLLACRYQVVLDYIVATLTLYTASRLQVSDSNTTYTLSTPIATQTQLRGLA
jgi:hypothetical protein